MAKNIFKKKRYISIPTKQPENRQGETGRPTIPEGKWYKCDSCNTTLYKDDIVNNMGVCPSCKKHFRMNAWDRIRTIIDENTFEEYDGNMVSSNPLDFPGYQEKTKGLEKRTGLREAVVSGYGKVNDEPSVIVVMDSRYMMGSMGSAVGEKVTKAIERATELSLPIIIFTASGGARMQEGIFSLMQMAKTSAALARHDEAKLLSITVLTDPTTGGVTASFAMLGDIILAEPGALIGFAGPRVIEQTIRQKLPEGFQRSEFLLEHGFIDEIVHRSKMKETLATLLLLHKREV